MTINETIDRQLEDLNALQEEIDEQRARVERLQCGITFHGSPIARTFAEMRTPRQLACLNAIERHEGIDVEGECQRLFGCQIADLSVKAASVFIGYLKGGNQ